MSEVRQKIPARLESAVKGGYVTGAKDIVDDALGKAQSVVNEEHKEAINDLQENVGTGGSVDERINAEKTRATNAERGLDTRLNVVEQLAEISVEGGEIGIGTAADFESDDPSDLAKVPTVSAILGGANDGVYDISARHNGIKYADLATALGTNGANIPVGIRRGGMSVKFIQSSDNKYVQFRYMSTSTAAADFTNTANWQGVDDEPTAGSDNLVKSEGVYLFNFKNLGIIYCCYIQNVYSSQGERHVFTPSPYCFYTELISIPETAVSIKWDYHDQGNNTLPIYDENKDIIKNYGASGSSRTIQVPSGAKYLRGGFDWTNHSTVKDWKVIAIDANNVETVLWDENRLPENILDSINSINTNLEKVVKVTTQSFTDAEKETALNNIANFDNTPTFRSKNLVNSGSINKALFANLGRIDFCKIVRVSGSAGYEFGYEVSQTCFLTELFDISSFVSVTWKYHDMSDGTYLAVYDENKNIIKSFGASGSQRTILVSSMGEGAKYVRATFDWAKHSSLKDWALIGTDSNDVQTILWDESHLESEILNSIGDLDSRVTALENPINDDSEKLFYEGSVEQPTLNSKRLNHDGSLVNYGGDTFKTSKLIAVNYGDTITFTGATNGASAPLIGYSKKEYETAYFVEDLMPAADLENDKLFTKSVKITNHNIKYVASCGYVKQGTYTFKVTCEAGHETIEDMIVMSSLHNYYPNAMSKAGGFVQKYLDGEDVNIVLLGDSITAVANQKQNTDLNKIPCFMEHQNWCYWLWKYMYKNDNIVYRRYDYSGFFSYTGDFVETSINSIEPYNYNSSDENAAFQFDWNLANYEKTNIILPKNGGQCYQGIKIEVLSNGAATDGIVEYYNGTTWVEANGVVLSLRLSADPDGTSTCRNMRHKFRRVSANGTVSIRVSKNGTEGYLQLWGVEQWNGQGVFISNAAWGGKATYELQSGHQTSLIGHRPDLVLFELTLVNNFGDRMYESNSKELMYNDFYDYIWGDRPDHANTLSLKTLSNDWVDWQVILVVPHWRQQWVDGDNFKMTIEGTPVKYSALDCYNVVKGLIKSKNDLEYLDLGSNMKQEAIKRGWTLEQSYAGTTNETMESIKCFTQDTVHLNNLGSKIYGMYIAPIFDI